MGKLYDEITPALANWVQQQRVFFVATAPLSKDGHVNCSPKGLDTLRVLGPHEVAYLDLTGSGAETIAHLRENGRIVLMFCALSGPPKIVRFHGTGTCVMPGSSAWNDLRIHFPGHVGERAIVHVQVSRISDSCGYGVPQYAYVEDRDALARWSRTKGLEALPAYRQDKNSRSIDGLPAVGAEESDD
jgi:pyridoxamine 5'-phosphate oxidase-like protein